MSATVQARGVSAAFGDRELFRGLDLVVAPGDVVGLVGANDAGKTTPTTSTYRPSSSWRRRSTRSPAPCCS